MKLKKLLSIVVAIFIVASCVSMTTGTFKNAYAQPDNEEAKKASIQDYYRENVQDIFKKYGIFDEKDSEISGDLDNVLSGLLEAKTVDITGDGYDELFLMYLEKGDIHMEILTCKSGDVIKDWEEVTMWSGLFNMNFCKDKSSGDYYWYYGVTRGFPAELFTYKDGKYQKVASDEIDYPEPTKAFGNRYDEGDFYLEHMKRHLGLTQKVDYNEVIFDYSGDLVLEPADSYALSTAWELINNESKSSEQVKSTSKTSLADTLGSIKYYGDKSKCKMTKEMALAYADAIEDDRTRANGISGATPHLSAALLDLAGDGMPILVTATTGSEEGDILYIKDGVPCISVWTWNGKKAEKYDFSKDMVLKYMRYISFYQNGADSMIRVNDGDVFLLMEDSHGTLDYKVSGGKISLKHHETIYVACMDYDNNQYAIGDCMPEIRTTPCEDGNLQASVEDLIYAGWVIWENVQSGEHLYMRSINGKLKPFADAAEAEKATTVEKAPPSGSEIQLFQQVYDEGVETLHVNANSMTGHMDMTDALRKYAESAGKPAYSYNEIKNTFTDSEVEKIANKIAKKYKGEVGEIYKLSDDLYYVIIYIDGKVSGTAIVKNTKNGKDWRIVKSYDKPANEDDLSKIVNKDQQTPNANIDFEKTDEGVKYVESVLKNIDGSTLNPSAKEELTKFIDTSISRCSAGQAEAQNNVIVIAGSKVKKVSDDAYNQYTDYKLLLEKHNITLNKPITIIVQFVVKNADSKKPIQIKLTKDILDSLEKADGLNLILDGTSCSVKVTKDSLNKIISQHGEISVILQDKGEGSYIIQFIDSNKKIIKKLCDSIIFTVPANNELCTIQAEYTGGTDNWGGQYDSVNKCLVFGASYSGTYNVLDKKIEIADIEKLTKEEQKAIRFMVSKGFLELDGKNFNPDADLTRYDFSKALVKMCFEADYDAKADFSDMKEDNPYYPYIASGAAKHIIEGYEDGTFRGENKALREEVVALCSRTLKEQKGYTEPQNPEDYLHFADNESIEWGHSEIALAVRQALIDDGGILAPQSPTSRKDAAIILYRLFMLLHEVEPVAIVSDNSEQNSSSDLLLPVASAVAGVAAIGAITTLIILLKKKKAAKMIAESASMIYSNPGISPENQNVIETPNEDAINKDDK